MIISPTNKFIFFKPIKAAGSSVEFSLFKCCGSNDLSTGGTDRESELGYTSQNNLYVERGEEFGRFHTHTWPDLFFERSAVPNEKWDVYHKVTIVRNPWDMCVSWYWWANRTGSLLSRAGVVCIASDDSQHVVKQKFEFFLNTLSEYPTYVPSSQKIHCTPLDYLATTTENFIHPCIDTYLRFESLNDDYEKLCNILKIDHFPLLTLKSEQRKMNHHYSYYYSKSSKKAVESRFRKVIDKFDYEFVHAVSRIRENR